MVLNAYIGKEDRSKINYFSFHFRKLEKAEQVKFKVSRKKDIIKLEQRSVKLKTGT